MAFYVKGNKEVAEYLGLKNNTGEDVVFLVSGNVILPYHVNELNKMEVLNIPEYKLHPVHGLIPADSKLFLENHVHSDKSADKMKTKEENENMNDKENKKVFEVGDKCVIKNVNDYLLMDGVKENFINQECKIVAKFKLSIPMVVVTLVEPEDPDLFGVCVVFREEMCHPIPTHKDMTLNKMREVCQYKGSWECTFKKFASDLYDAGLRFKDDVE